jgi:glycosyltransferase involved in cell wall biosynthesis
MTAFAAGLVSCVIPVYNGEHYLTAALDSVFAQTHRPIEVIVVDDGSTDGSARLLDRYGDRLVRLARANGGPAAARNDGVARATGEFLAFLDCDDLWVPGRLAAALARLRARPEIGYCACHVENFVSPELDRTRETPEPGSVLPGFVFSAMLIRHATFREMGPLDASLAHSDSVEWVLRAESAGVKRELMPETLVRRRVHDGNWSQRRFEDSHDEFLAIVKARLDERKQPRP